jgi:hypothetical protein
VINSLRVQDFVRVEVMLSRPVKELVARKWRFFISLKLSKIRSNIKKINNNKYRFLKMIFR